MRKLTVAVAIGLLVGFVVPSGVARADVITDPGGLLYHLDAAQGITQHSVAPRSHSQWAGGVGADEFHLDFFALAQVHVPKGVGITDNYVHLPGQPAGL